MGRNRRAVADGGLDLPEEVQKVLARVETMPGDPARSFMRRNGFKSLKPERFRRGRQVYTHKDTQDLVYKVAVDDGNWQNEIEASVWFDDYHPSVGDTAPKEAKTFLTPILRRDERTGNDTWLIMPRAETRTAEARDAIELVDEMSQYGWVVTDYHPDNIGYLDGDYVFVDYGQLKPSEYLADDWREDIRDLDW